MSEQAIKPERITKPMQLLGAWLAGLFSIDSCFLVAAANLTQGSFESYALTLAAIANVPIFLLAVFLLQTKFRPELQEDSYYSTYLSQKTNQRVTVSKSEAHFAELSGALASIRQAIEESKKEGGEVKANISDLLIGINTALPDFENIKSALSDQGVHNCTTFGNNSLPPYRVVALSPNLSRQQRNETLRFAKSIGFKNFSYFSSGDEDIFEDVLLGAYGEPEQEIL